MWNNVLASFVCHIPRRLCLASLMRALWVAWVFLSPPNVLAAPNDYYLLPRLAYVMVNLQHVAPLYAVGLSCGWRFDNNLSVEVDFNRSVSGGSFTDHDPSGRAIGAGRYQLQTYAGFGVYRLSLSPGFYAKAKTGLVYEQVLRRATQNRKRAARAGLSIGAGLGYAVNHALTTELDLDGVEQDMAMLLLGLHYRWQ